MARVGEEDGLADFFEKQTVATASGKLTAPRVLRDALLRSRSCDPERALFRRARIERAAEDLLAVGIGDKTQSGAAARRLVACLAPAGTRILLEEAVGFDGCYAPTRIRLVSGALSGASWSDDPARAMVAALFALLAQEARLEIERPTATRTGRSRHRILGDGDELLGEMPFIEAVLFVEGGLRQGTLEAHRTIRIVDADGQALETWEVPGADAGPLFN